jgi:glycosyltransferase involved in cell wall biosynthesis
VALVSVVIPTYNRATYVCEAVESVLGQSFRDVEIIVVDDGSTDETASILSRYGDAIRYFHQPNSGQSVARNRGILAATGRYVAFLDSDDTYYPDKLAEQVAFMEARPEIAFCWTDYSQGPTIPEKPQGRSPCVTTDDERIFDRLCRSNVICTVTVMVRQDSFAASGLFDPVLRASEDYDLWLRLANARRGAFLPRILTHVRDHDGRTMGTFEYHRNRVETLMLQVRRWDAERVTRQQRRDLRCHLASNLTQLGWRERFHGSIRAAGRSFVESSRYCDMGRGFRNVVRGCLYLAFPWVFRWYDRWIGRLRS